MRILLVDDDEALMESLSQRLIHQRYAVDIATDGASARSYLDLFNYDLIVLDLMLPDGDGIEFCRQFRSAGYRSPVMILTAKESTAGKVEALDAGADDYIVKPFSFDELCARIRALLRRDSQGLPPILHWGALALDPSTYEVSYHHQPLRLTPKEFAMMELFLRHPHRVYSLSSIMDDLWSFEDPPGEDAIRTHVKGLRRKLKLAGAPKDLVKTVYGLGYRLNEDLAEMPTVEAPVADGSAQGLATAADAVAVKSVALDQAAIDQAAVEPVAIDQAATDPSETIAESAAPWSRLWSAPPRVKPAATIPLGQAAAMIESRREAISQACERYLMAASAQIETVEAAAAALLSGALEADLHSRSQMNAHKLTGSMGSFGIPEGSNIARKIEAYLRAIAESSKRITTSDSKSDPVSDPKTSLAPAAFAQLVKQLRESLEQTTVQTATALIFASVQSGAPLLLIVSEDERLSQQLAQAAVESHFQAQVVADPALAEGLSRSTRMPDLVLIDMPTTAEPFLDLIRQIKQTCGSPIVALAHQLPLSDRLNLVQHGVALVGDRQAPSDQIMAAAASILKVETHQIKVAIADDDPQMLSLLKTSLEPWGFDVRTFETVRSLWQWLSALPVEASLADILVLDIEMPEMTGIELCRVLRADTRFQHLPILFLTAHQENHWRLEAFQAGADDFVNKAIAPAELALRLRNQLARMTQV